ncbi:MAG: DUF4160 domain-containing protein [Chloroflexi bacterium]|nr:DUF4160 domain-containing protein [Chloroflexota bacterium]
MHAYYQNYRAVFGIDPIEIIAGELPRRQQRFVEAWMKLYQEELLENWNLAANSRPINRLPPLQ